VETYEVVDYEETTTTTFKSTFVPSATADESTLVEVMVYNDSTSLDIVADQPGFGDTKPGETDRLVNADNSTESKWENTGFSKKELSPRANRPKHYGNQMHTLAYYALVQRKQFEELARHPVLQLFLELKWNQMQYNAIILTFIPMMIFHCSYIVSMYLVYYIDCPKQAGK